MQTTYVGRQAETVAAGYLRDAGYTIVDRNWRRRECEIDLIATKDGVIYFIEVKYRSDGANGGGLDYVTAAKLRRMAYAAERWVTAHDWHGEYGLAAIELAGQPAEVTAFIESIDL